MEDTTLSADEEARQGQRKHIFMVNHDPKFLDLVRQLLQDANYNVTTTNYVPRTWDQIAALQPDLLVVDLSVLSGAGWDLLERLHAQGVTQRIPIIVTSTDPGLLARLELECDRYGGDRLVAKPFHVEVLLDAIHTLIGAA
jgi:DNA-binding response OmpR family regulator